ncbi:DUF5681 domain-containing protein [Bradyrhizobium sp. CB1015]|uniref:DUF5681 domain-containing protein n=1 Tax=Bradyrhizobium sp. CB1015 TaxID=2976822 RepID=UPI0021AA0B3B|nr:DUF5681 domain-containing protein [Bradyrhizobium sp. CB1015]UWU90609.1 DUF5681 domain-containing protein [Bradyrhizobium sp. CB1015]
MVERIRPNPDKKMGTTEADGTEVGSRGASTGAVGYGNPPKHSQFKPGQSGNPKGRPKGSRNFKTDLRETLQSPVNVTQHGREKRITTQRATLEMLRAKALRGDQRALEQLIRLLEKYDEPEARIDAPLGTSDQAILDAYVRRSCEV